MLCYVYLMVDRKAAAGLSRLKQVLTAQQSLAAVTKWPLMNEMRCPMPARMILALMLGMLVLPACQQDEPPLTTEGAISLREKAEQGQVSAQLQLGRMYDMGQGVPKDDKEAVRWYQAAANQGDADSQSRLGLMYATGKGIPQDYKEAFRWYQPGFHVCGGTGSASRLQGNCPVVESSFRAGTCGCPEQPWCHVYQRTGCASRLYPSTHVVQPCRFRASR